jgi:hypothetical protein
MLNNYFYQLEIPILLDTEKDELISLALANDNDFKSYIPVKGVPDGNQVWRGNALYEKHFIKRLVDNCNLPCMPLFVRHQPGVKVFKHVDEPNKRNTVLSFPLTPKVNYPPTYFFVSREETTPIAIARFPLLNACLLNTQEVHALVNTSEEVRINFQICFNDSFEVVREMIIKKTLFNIDI